MTYRVLITGSRTWVAEELLRSTLDGIRWAKPEMVLVHGACPRGADALADKWATDHDVEVERHPADWETHGRAAGFRRNIEMVNLYADVCVAFIRDASKGASHCARAAELAGIQMIRVEHP
jgi:hypothetical protein